MIKYCATCKTIKDLMPQPYTRRTLKDGTKTGSYMCRGCNAERGKRYRKTATGAANFYKSTLNQNRKYPKKYKARCMVRDAIKNGSIHRPSECSACSKETTPDAHHPDYNKPLEVLWLCRQCHIGLHRKL